MNSVGGRLRPIGHWQKPHRAQSALPQQPLTKFSLLPIALLALVCTGLRADYQKGLNAYVDGDYKKAMDEWKKEVNRPGEPESLAVYRETLYAIGMLYWRGEGVAQDYAVAAVWMKQAADINHPGAQNKLGYLYVTGQGVPQNFQQARHYFEMAAAQGDPDARHNLDQMFQQGLMAASETSPAAPPVEQLEQTQEDVPLPVEQLEQAQQDDALPAEQQEQAQQDVAVAAGPPGQEQQEDAMPVEQQEQAQQDVAIPDEPARAEAVAAAPAPVTPEPSPKAPDQVPVVRGDKGVDWIRAQNPEHYTIQVIALRAPDKLSEFIDRFPEWAPFAIYRPRSNERPLWVLIQGDYANVEAARVAVRAFPTRMQKRDQLWIRKFGMVQRIIE